MKRLLTQVFFLFATGCTLILGSPGVGAGEPPRKCYGDARDRQNEVCAAWVSADASAEAANWAFWQMLLSGAGFAGLLYSLYLTRRATAAAIAAGEETAAALATANRDADAAEQMVTVARENAERELRANLDFCKPRFVGHDHLENAGRVSFDVMISVRNFGRTAARGLSTFTEVYVIDKMTAERTQIGISETNSGIVAQSDRVRETKHITVFKETYDAIKAGECWLFFNIVARYQDEFAKERSVSATFRSSAFGTLYSMPGTRTFS